jgi:hypothetical protein
MPLSSRLQRVEANLNDALLWQEAERVAARTGGNPRELVARSWRLVNQYEHLIVPLPRGRMDLEPMLRAIAEAERLDYEQLATEVEALLPRIGARERSRRGPR